MSFEKLKEAILAEADTRVAAVEQEYTTKLKREESRIKQRARELEEDIIRRAEARGEQEQRRLHQEQKLAAKARVLEAKQEELATAQATAVQQILGWAGDQQQELLAGLLALVPKGEGTLIPGSLHREALQKLARKHKLSVSEDSVAQEGGFIYQGDNTEINLTIGHLVERVFARHRAALARHLFD